MIATPITQVLKFKRDYLMLTSMQDLEKANVHNLISTNKDDIYDSNLGHPSRKGQTLSLFRILHW